MAGVPGSGGDHVDLGFELKQVRCNARDLAKTLQELVQEAADAEGTAEMIMESFYYLIKIFPLSDNDDFLIVYPEYSQE